MDIVIIVIVVVGDVDVTTWSLRLGMTLSVAEAINIDAGWSSVGKLLADCQEFPAEALILLVSYTIDGNELGYTGGLSVCNPPECGVVEDGHLGASVRVRKIIPQSHQFLIAGLGAVVATTVGGWT